jgi:hypothetical protein
MKSMVLQVFNILKQVRSTVLQSSEPSGIPESVCSEHLNSESKRAILNMPRYYEEIELHQLF